jgi:hypothetical protein
MFPEWIVHLERTANQRLPRTNGGNFFNLWNHSRPLFIHHLRRVYPSPKLRSKYQFNSSPNEPIDGGTNKRADTSLRMKKFWRIAVKCRNTAPVDRRRLWSRRPFHRRIAGDAGCSDNTRFSAVVTVLLISSQIPARTGQWAVNGAGCHTSSTAPVYENL